MKILFILPFCLFILISSCKKKEEKVENNFNKNALLVQVGEKIILPGLVDLKSEINLLINDWEAFKTLPNQQNLDALKTKWLDANIRFQRIKVFNFGPTLTHGIKASFGTFPTDTAKINANAFSASPNVNSLSNLDAVGFPALEYLFFQNNAFTALNNQQELRNYVDLILAKMQSEINLVENEWSNSYANSFENSTGTESTSGFSLLINAFNQDFELAKNAKLGIPIGKQSLGIPQMEYEEAPFAKISLRLLQENLLGLHNLYFGIGHDGVDGIGLDDYLVALEKPSIYTGIRDRFNYTFVKTAYLGDDLAFEISVHPADLDELYVNLQAMIVHFKTDMTSAFGVLITYQDNDGD